LPAGHASQLAAFSNALNVPAGQSSHSSPFTKVPGLQIPQYPSDAPPQPLRFAPPSQSAHGLQLLCPASSWYVSIAHALQVGAPAADTKPAGHGEHAVWPSRDWERPSSHATQ